ncbi:uncharacterized protein F5147DRAFT_715762 [Suillus discolor]|uniref:GATA-type domain-containing protein n=1 Tax=Suillus discolor TaxID=1912936 RepID=A0A9P7EY07_9AGAM|nr:uncharacterized protein F5147DRAFT_715762 [Suillus discolor]KAG2097014.1 hypothetical protein F5147DRAFT_715762 [Suillus discolor]
MFALSTSTSLPPFIDNAMSQYLPKVSETRCYWSLLSSELDFVYLDPVLTCHLETQADLLIGKSLLFFVHPEEQATARADLAEALEQRTMHGSVTRVRYCRLARIRRILGHKGPTQPWPDGDKVSVDAYYMVVDIVINWAAEGLVLCFIHAVVDLEPGDNDEHHRTPWTNWCGTPCMHPEQITLLQQRLLYYFPQSTVTTRVFQILFNNQQDCRLLLSWPSDSSQEYPGMPGAKDFARRAVCIQTSTPDVSAKTSCTRRWRIQDTMPGIGEVESVFILHGSITFACHAIQQPASQSLSVSYSQSQPFTRSTDAYMPAHRQHHPYDLSASPYTLPPVSTSMPQPYGHYTQSLTSQYSHSPWGSDSEPSSSRSQFDRWPAQSPAHSMASLPPSPIYGENRASLSNYRATPSPEDYSANAAFGASVPPAPPCGTDIVPPPRHRVSPGLHKDTLPHSTNNRPLGVLKCSSCKATSSPEWRKGPSGRKELCNACGLRYARSRAKKEGYVVSTQRRKKDKTGVMTANEESAVPSTPPIPITGMASRIRRGAVKRSTFTSSSSVGSGSGSESYSQPNYVAAEDNRPSPSPPLPSLNFVRYHPYPPSSGQPQVDDRTFPYHTSSPFQPSSPLSAPVNPRSVVPATRHSRSSGSLSSAMGYSYSSDSLSSTFSMGHSYFPSSSQSPPPSASRPIATKKLFTMDDDGFQPTPSPKDLGLLLRSPYQTHQFSHSPQTPDELPRSGQSSNFRARPSSQDMRHGYCQAQHVHQYDDDVDNSDLPPGQVASGSSLPNDIGAMSISQRRTRLGTRTPSSPCAQSSPNTKNKAATRPQRDDRNVFGTEHRNGTETDATVESNTTSGNHIPSPELTRAPSHSLRDLTNKLQGRSRYPITSGGFGDIWKCDLVKPDGTVQVAVKTIRAFESDDEVLIRKNSKRVRRELKVWGRLKHDSILPLWGVANDFGPYPAMICPWADNGALTGYLGRQESSLSSYDKFSLLNDIALGLRYQNVLITHVPTLQSNVLIYANGRACLADFGLSTIILEFVGTSYFTNSTRGHVRWVAAELCEVSEDDELSLSTECDIYSFGSITLQVLTCKVPYYNVKKDIAVLGQVIKGIKPEPPKESQIAPGHWEFIQRCWLPRASRPSIADIVVFITCERQAV